MKAPADETNHLHERVLRTRCHENFATRNQTKCKWSSTHVLRSKHSRKNSMNEESLEYLKLINKSIKEKLSAPLVDDFEKGYFSVWKIFVKLSLGKLEINNEKRIIENPRKEEQTNKSSNASSE